MAKKKNTNPKSSKSKSTKAQAPQQKVDPAVRRSLLIFWGSFIGVMILYFILSVQPFWVDYVFKPVVKAYAWLSSGMLNLMGFGTTSDGMVVSSSDFALEVSKGCDGLTPIMLLVTGILVYPVAFKWKGPGLLFGISTLWFLNLIRIVSLFVVGIYLPNMFEIFHVEIWQAIFIVIAVLLWFYWLVWANRKKLATHAST